MPTTTRAEFPKAKQIFVGETGTPQHQQKYKIQALINKIFVALKKHFITKTKRLRQRGKLNKNAVVVNKSFLGPKIHSIMKTKRLRQRGRLKPNKLKK